MAARENQGYLIAVIILVLLSLVLALLAFLGLSKASENGESKKALETEIAFLKKNVESADFKGEILKAVLGDFGVATAEVQTSMDAIESRATSPGLSEAQKGIINGILEDVQEIKEGYDSDMAGSVTEGGVLPTYRERIRNLTQLVAVKNSEYNIQVNQTRQSEEEAKTKIAAMEKQVAANEKAKNEAQEELAEVKELSLKKEETLKEQVKGFTVSLEKEKEIYSDFQSEKNAEVRKAEDKIAEVAKENEHLKTKVNRYESEVFDRPDGNVVKVASGLRSVYIDLGTADGLTNNMTFAIYDRNVTNFEKNKHKAMIEVTNVDPFSAVARITEENPVNPILGGDHILTATWDPGFTVPIAVAGRFDLDGDNNDDLEKLVRMIERNGGTVVAKHDEEGNIEGKIDASVRYLVTGDSPHLGEGYNPAIVSAMKQLVDQAEANTVTKIGLQKFLNLMGVRGKPKTVQMEDLSGGFQSRNPSDTSKSDDR